MAGTDQLTTAAVTDALALWNQLWALECAYWADVDFNFGECAADYYTEDAVFDIGLAGSRLEGRQAIRRFYAGRREAGPRTTLHVVNNFTVREQSATSARASCIVSLYGRDGLPPQDSAGPILMTAAENSYVKTDGGTWKIGSRLNNPCFVDATRLPVDRVRQAADAEPSD